MKRALSTSLTVLVLGVTCPVGPAAYASNADVIHGGCFDEAVSNPALTGDSYLGAIADYSMTTTGDTPPAPIGATITCWLEVNGVVAPGTTRTYSDVGGVSGVQAGSDPIAFVANPEDSVSVCTSVGFDDGQTTSFCATAVDAIGIIGQLLTQGGPWCGQDVIVACLDQAACPEFVSLSGDYGPIAIRPDGDIYVADPLGLGLSPVYDCPPYGNF